MSDLAAAVTKPMVGVLLAERPPDILERTYGDPPVRMFDVAVQRIVVEVVAVAGSNLHGARRDLAVQCVAYGVGAEIEYSEFPEQQLQGGIGRGWFLKRKYEELLALLRTMPANGSGGGLGNRSRGRFPKPRPYPDPFRGA